MRYITAEKERFLFLCVDFSSVVFTAASLVVMSNSEVKAQRSMFVSSHDSEVYRQLLYCRSKKRLAWVHLQEERQKADVRQISHQIGQNIYVQQICR